MRVSTVVGDLPWMSYHVSREETVCNAAALIRAGAGAVKLEGGRKRLDSVRAILGYAPEEILGTNASQYVHPEDLAALDFAMHTLGPGQRTASNLQARWRHRNGSYRWLERNMLVLLDERSQVSGFRGSERDFTERRRRKHISRLTRVLKMLAVSTAPWCASASAAKFSPKPVAWRLRSVVTPAPWWR
jgi:PAS domain S-box-containing protein